MKFNLCMNVMALLLAVVMVATPVTAATSDPAEPMASALLSDYSASASRPTSGAVKVKYSVTGMTLLDKIGAKVSAYDPEAEEEAKEDLRPGVLVKASLEKAIEGAEIIFVATDWPEFKNTDWLSNVGKETVIVDCMNCLEGSAIIKDYMYIGVGR